MKKALAVFLAALLCLALGGCGAARADRVTKTGFVGSSTSTKWTGRFKSYNGSESKVVRAREGKTLVISFALEAEEGELLFTAEGPDGMERFNTGDADVKEGTLNIESVPCD